MKLCSQKIGLYSGSGRFRELGKAEDKEGVKVQRFEKEMLSVGHYIHPIWGWHLDITEERLHRLVASFKQMRGNGVDVEVPIDHSFSAADNYGYVVEVSVRENSRGVPALFGVHEMRGEEGISLAKRNKNVSVCIEKDYKDGKGNFYGEAITHSSIVQQPVVPGQDDFQAVAASISQKAEVPMFFNQSGVQKMNEELLKAIREMIGADDSLTEDNALSRLKEHMSGLSQQKDDLQKKIGDLEGEVEALKSKSASRQTPEIDPNLAEQMADVGEQKLSLLVEKGKITPAVKDKLAASLIGKSGSRNLSALRVGQGSPSILNAVVDALQENDPVKLGEQTGVQVLSRKTPKSGDGTNEDDAYDENTRKSMSRMTGMVK